MMILTCIKQHLSNIWSTTFMKKLSNSDAEFKKNVTFIAEPSGEYPERNFADDTQTEKTKKNNNQTWRFRFTK